MHATYIAHYFDCPFINADIIQRNELGDPSPEASFQAAEITAARRVQHLEASLGFAAETIFSHPSKLDLITEARARGFTVRVMHVGVEAADISVARASDRITEGSHAVLEHKVRERDERSPPLIRAAVLKAHHGLVSAIADLPRWILKLYRDDLAL